MVLYFVHFLIALGFSTAFTLLLNGVEDTFAMRKALTVDGSSLTGQDYEEYDANGPFSYGQSSKGMNSTSFDDQAM